MVSNLKKFFNMCKTILRTRPLTSGSRGYFQPETEVKYTNKSNNQSLTFPKGIGGDLRRSGCEYVEYKVNDIEKVVYLVFSSVRTPESLKIDFGDKPDENIVGDRKFILRSKCIIEYLQEDLGIGKNVETLTLKVSQNIANSQDLRTYRISKA